MYIVTNINKEIINEISNEGKNTFHTAYTCIKMNRKVEDKQILLHVLTDLFIQINVQGNESTTNVMH